jgi:hypothetical protein
MFQSIRFDFGLNLFVFSRTTKMATAKSVEKIIHDGPSGIEGEGVKLGEGLGVGERSGEVDGFSDGIGVGEGEAVGIGVGVGDGEPSENVMSVSLMGSSNAVTVPFCGKTL